MNVGIVKTASYLASTLLLVGVAYVAYDYYTDGRNRAYFDLKRADSVLNNVKSPAAPRAAALDYEDDIKPAILLSNWTGALPEIVEESVSTATDEVVARLTPVSEVLEVLMVLVDERDPGESLCLVRLADLQADPSDRWFAVGSTAKSPEGEFSVYRITGAGVEFSFEDEEREREFLTPSSLTGADLIESLADGTEFRTRSGTSLIAIAGQQESDLRARTEQVNGQFYLGTEDAEAFAQDYQSILSSDVKTRTYMKDGKRAGVEITEVREGSIAGRHGAQSGDVVISINGTPVGSQQEAFGFAKANSERYSVWTVEVLRLGRVETLVYHSPGK